MSLVNYRIVEQIGDITFQLNGHTYPSLGEAMIALLDLDDRYDGDRDFFVDGPGLTCPVGVGGRHATTQTQGVRRDL